MFIEKITTPGLAHHSYLLGDGGEAVVIDPRRDCTVYLERARAAGQRIRYVLETHRNEDYVVGTRELNRLTGAEMYHADPDLEYRYGQPVHDSQSWKVGGLTLRAIHTPGHTPGSMSYLLEEQSGGPWMVFCGDVCFAGDVGRVDLLGTDRMEEMAQKLYESLFERLFPLGDEVILCPAHGAGSVCGSTIADRAWTTIGLERRVNPKLQNEDRDAFVAAVAHAQPRPPYFRRIEALNLHPPGLEERSWAAPLDLNTFAEKKAAGSVIDIRSVEAYGGGHLPDALALWASGLASFGGWFLSYDQDLVLVADDAHSAESAHAAELQLLRMGYDRICGYLSGGLNEWHKAGRPIRRLEMVSPPELCRRLDGGEQIRLLDVRRRAERRQEGRLAGAKEIPLEDFAANPAQTAASLEKSSAQSPLCVFCGSGLRSTLAASLLERNGHTDLMVVLGGTQGWSSTRCPLEKTSK
jgi:hydroxyacylglutathione hydrolase